MHRTETIGNATLHLGDCLQLSPSLGNDFAVVSDPPYGGRFNMDSKRFTGGTDEAPLGAGRDDRAVIGDDKDFDPSPWLRFSEVILWGANHYAARLPLGSMLVWIKKYPKHYGMRLSDAEIGWQAGGYGVYCFNAPDSNARRRMEATGSAFGEATAHPTQKPLALMDWCVERTRAGAILDPYMGSGTTGIAAIRCGRRFVGIEKDPAYFDIACRRVSEAARQPELTLSGAR